MVIVTLAEGRAPPEWLRNATRLATGVYALDLSGAAIVQLQASQDVDEIIEDVEVEAH